MIKKSLIRYLNLTFVGVFQRTPVFPSTPFGFFRGSAHPCTKAFPKHGPFRFGAHVHVSAEADPEPEHACCNTLLVGGFNPSEKYERQIGFIFPKVRGENKKYLKPPPRLTRA